MTNLLEVQATFMVFITYRKRYKGNEFHAILSCTFDNILASSELKQMRGVMQFCRITPTTAILKCF